MSKKEESFALSEILILEDKLPVDFYTNKDYDKKIDVAIEQTKNLVYSLDDEGEKAAKADATAINKFVTLYTKFIAATFKLQTEVVSAWRSNKKSKLDLLIENRQRLLDQFAEKRTEKLHLIRDKLTQCLLSSWDDNSVKPEFRNGDIMPLVKLSGTLTDTGNLTAKAVKFCEDIAKENLQHQQKIEGRHLILENKCLRADINPPLTQVHFGSVFYAEDDVFNAKLNELIESEVQRRAEMEARIIKQQEAQKQKEIEAALKSQQDEANRNAEEKIRRELTEEPRTTEPETKVQVTQEHKQETDKNDPVKYPDKRSVLVTVVFKFDGISNRVSNQAVVEFCIKQMPEKLQAIITDTSYADV